MRKAIAHITMITFLSQGLAQAASDSPNPVAVTRAAMKQALEASKSAKSRLPIPQLSDEEAAKIGPFGKYNNPRSRMANLPTELAFGDFSRDPDPAMKLDGAFKTELFWIVSRLNNCIYCMGHQESKLARAGRTDDQIAALDGDWSEFSPKEKAAFAVARKLTESPHRFGDEDVRLLLAHYPPPEALEILFTVSNNNATNRWTGPLNLTQEPFHDYSVPTSPKYAARRSAIAPALDGPGPLCAVRVSSRGNLPNADEIEALLARCRTRSPRFALQDEAETRKRFTTLAPDRPVPNWARLLANFPVAGKYRFDSLMAARDKGTLPPLLKARIAQVAALNDRAGYALADAQRRIEALGASIQVAANGNASGDLTPADRVALQFVQKLTVAPAAMTDADFEKVGQHFGQKQVAELILHACHAAFFDRFTEASGLPLDAES